MGLYESDASRPGDYPLASEDPEGERFAARHADATQNIAVLPPAHASHAQPTGNANVTANGSNSLS